MWGLMVLYYPQVFLIIMIVQIVACGLGMCIYCHKKPMLSMNSYFEKLKAYIQSKPTNYGDSASVLTMLYECHNESNTYDN